MNEERIIERLDAMVAAGRITENEAAGVAIDRDTPPPEG